MMNELLRFKRTARGLGMCERYKAKWDAAETKADIMRIATDVNGMEFLAGAMAFGWGLSPSYIADVFGDYINGAMVIGQDGYTSEMFVGLADMQSDARATATIYIACHGVITVCRNCLRRIYVCANSDVLIENDGICELYSYGENTVKTAGNGIFRREYVTQPPPR